MDFLKELFEGKEALSWDDFSKAVSDKGYKLADLSTGNYVAKRKFDDEIASRDSQIENLNSQITTRDGDLEALKTQLENGNLDNKTKVADLTSQLTKLQGDYETSKAEYEAQLNKQAYEFAVSEYASGLKFSSKAAQRDFKEQMISAGLKMQDNKILGADDFKESWAKDNEDAFLNNTPPENNEPPKPQFIQPTPPGSKPGETNPFIEAFNFLG